jgi:S-sulfosulfanyl-L-cysteine sulfohydrolase
MISIRHSKHRRKFERAMLTRRDFLGVAGAAAALTGLSGRLGTLSAQQSLTEADLLRFDAKGRLTLLHVTDCHAQLRPIYFREPSVNIGVGAMTGLPPHLTDAAFLEAFGIAPGSPHAYALSAHDFGALARTYGRVGGMDRLATLVRAIRRERGAGNVLLLDGGDTLHGSYTALQSRGGDMVRVLEALGAEATTGHWEFTLGHQRMSEVFGDATKPGSAKTAFLAGNIRENDFNDPVFQAFKLFERGGTMVAVIGQAFPFTPIANPRWMMPNWAFGIREDDLRKNIKAARAAGAQVIVLLSHNGFDVDRKLAARVDGIDVILSAHTHDALPQPVKVRNTLLIASGSHTKFLSRLDLDLANGRIVDFGYALIPVLADAITPDADMAQLITAIRAPHEAMLSTELARTDSLLYRRGNVAGTLDDVICDALLVERDAEISFSPGFRWGNTLLPGDPITWDDVYNATALTYPKVYRQVFSGATLKAILEDVADNLFNPDPYYQQGGDMVRVGGMAFSVHVDAAMGQRIQNMTHIKTGAAIAATKDYVVAGWASVNEETEGPAIWDVVAAHLQRSKTVGVKAGPETVKLVRG